ncbi:ribosomal-protein-alanine N-acetyltransferase [Liquorilactobacillus sucicola DSM 21376 = JCM 15457]|uniref:Ribosomal-protein-alanine N-acetyltransferase n=1 Tax=Liquorilactobacillus sucicola DSM 21376 = JCM 15457 TaxID=1423806 RepID=A0A0R2E064_9LACO|nr:ribosomal-protein-alanine N-acetyltransferase [Liquorilactobacillus sucicola DSM 21376 = JCM 15457]
MAENPKQTEFSFKNRHVLINKKSFLVSRAIVPDIPELLKMQEKVYPNDNSWNFGVFEAEIKNKNNNLYLIMRHEDRLVAFIGAFFDRRKRDVHITNVAVTPIFQRKGLGRYLLEVMIDYADELNYRSLSLEVRLSNKTAQALYKSLGFTSYGLKKEYYVSNREDAVDMRYEFSRKGNGKNE